MPVWLPRALTAAATVLALALGLRRGLDADLRDAIAVAAVCVIAVLTTEIGRWVEGGHLVGQRPHKGLSGWAFAIALISAAPVVVPVTVVFTYAYARLRGMRVPIRLWTGSAAAVALGALAAQAVVHAAAGWAEVPAAPGRALLLVLGAGLVFVGIEAAVFLGYALSDRTPDGRWLRDRLRAPSFHLTEAEVLAAAGIVALLYLIRPELVMLTVPAYVLAQRALLVPPLGERADRDGTTRLLTYAAWGGAAQRELSNNPSCAVVLVDLDDFGAINDRFGHLIGDEVLAAAAAALRRCLRAQDVAGRFRGDEFCVLLPDVTPAQATAICERARAAVAGITIEGTELRVTASAGICVGHVGVRTPLPAMLEIAEGALEQARERGPDRSVLHRPAGDGLPIRSPGEQRPIQAG